MIPFRELARNALFQAEDGIRDTSVTGVQTCALPIWRFNGSTCWLPVCPGAEASVPFAAWSGGIPDLSPVEGVELWATAKPVARTLTKNNEKNRRKTRNFMSTNVLLEKHFGFLNCMFLDGGKQGCRRE